MITKYREGTLLRSKLGVAQRADLVRRYHAGESATDLARKIGLSPSTVSKTLRRLGVALRSPRAARVITTEREKQIIGRYRAGVGSPTVARELGLRVSTVEALIQRRGILRPLGAYKGVPRPSRRRFSESQEDEMIRLYRSGVGTAEIGARYGYTGNSRHSTVNRILARRGIPRRGVAEAQGGCPDSLFERVRKQYLAGQSCKEIAASLRGRYSADAVRGLLRRHGITLRQGADATRGRHRTGTLVLSKRQQLAAIARYKRGEPATDIASRMHIHYSTIYHLLRDQAVPLHRRLEIGRPESFAEAVRLYSTRRMTIPQIAAHLRVTAEALRGSFRRRGVHTYGGSEARRVLSSQGFRPTLVSPPKRNTKIELRLQNALRERGIPFTRAGFVSHPALRNGGKEFDLVLPHYVLVEVDGEWKRDPKHPGYRAARQVMREEAASFRAMKLDGYTVLRFWGRDIEARLASVVGVIEQAVALGPTPANASRTATATNRV